MRIRVARPHPTLQRGVRILQPRRLHLSQTPSDFDVAVPAIARAQASRTYARGLWRIAAADVSAGNQVALLRNGPAAFDAMAALIEAARVEVSMEQYIFRRDDVGLRFRDALVAAARRGIRVRLLVDWVGRMGTPMSFFAPITEAGGEVRIFQRPGLRPWLGLLPRDHRKLLVVDRTSGITGGIGIGMEWKNGILRQRRSPWRDTAVRIAGPAAVDMATSFDRMWTLAGGTVHLQFGSLRTPNASHLDPYHDPPSLVGIIEGEPARQRVSRALQMQAIGAERSIWLASAYFAPSWSVVEALAGAARDGVDVRVLVPSRYDHPWLRTLISPFIRRLLGSGVRLWEWRGEMMHAKTSVVDGRWVRVGSTDYNLLGVAINYELDAVIEDPTLGQQAEAMFLEDLEQSRELFVRRPHGAKRRADDPPTAVPALQQSGPGDSGPVRQLGPRSDVDRVVPGDARDNPKPSHASRVPKSGE
ncbi:MAG: phosphatidylserine/phosphatidylglycerophosphate/cardiolipin synthase family protein [Gemmatimonadaceae bacterium]|nr:phosphatidylserine/phosphatidylglycerophosphate/cardiolipin synthase family protein [Gemmatimonadaceae bacterium]